MVVLHRNAKDTFGLLRFAHSPFCTTRLLDLGSVASSMPSS